jgi:hypothetical protein
VFPFEQIGLLSGPFVRRSDRFHRGPPGNLAVLAHRHLSNPALHDKLALQV